MEVKAEFHSEPVPYVSEHKYYPDFKVTIGGRTVYLEAKGYFQEASEASKYVWVRKCLPEDQELIFIFEGPHKKLPWAKQRTDGSYMTHGEWATKNNFRWYSPEDYHELFIRRATPTSTAYNWEACSDYGILGRS
jgi:hypothetical protein